MGLVDADKLIEELEELEEYFENESNRPDDGLANPQRYRDTMSGVAQGLNHAITVILDLVENQRYEIANTESAIPIEWIKDLSNRLKDEDNFEKAMFLLDMIDVWDVENK